MVLQHYLKVWAKKCLNFDLFPKWVLAHSWSALHVPILISATLKHMNKFSIDRWIYREFVDSPTAAPRCTNCLRTIFQQRWCNLARFLRVAYTIVMKWKRFRRLYHILKIWIGIFYLFLLSKNLKTYWKLWIFWISLKSTFTCTCENCITIWNFDFEYHWREKIFMTSLSLSHQYTQIIQ